MSTAERFDLTDKVAVVTGGSRGLGRSMVLAFAEAGADVVIASRKLDNCEALAKEVEASTGRTAVPVACHVSRSPGASGRVERTSGCPASSNVSETRRASNGSPVS